MGTLKNRYFRHPADSNPLIIQAPNLRKLYFSRCPYVEMIIPLHFQVFQIDFFHLSRIDSRSFLSTDYADFRRLFHF